MIEAFSSVALNFKLSKLQGFNLEGFQSKFLFADAASQVSLLFFLEYGSKDFKLT